MQDGTGVVTGAAITVAQVATVHLMYIYLLWACLTCLHHHLSAPPPPPHTTTAHTPTAPSPYKLPQQLLTAPVECPRAIAVGGVEYLIGADTHTHRHTDTQIHRQTDRGSASLW